MKLTIEEKTAKKKKSAFFNFIKNILRRASYKWSGRTEAFKKSRIKRGLYKCAHCEGIFKNREIQLDHIEPVVSIKDGFTTWDDYINRLFVDGDGFQVLCINCHEIKTKQENEMRDFYTEKRLAKKKD